MFKSYIYCNYLQSRPRQEQSEHCSVTQSPAVNPELVTRATLHRCAAPGITPIFHKVTHFKYAQTLSHLSLSLGSPLRLFLSLLEVVSSEQSRLGRPLTPLMLAVTELPHGPAYSPSTGMRLVLLLAALRLRAEASVATKSLMTNEK